MKKGGYDLGRKSVYYVVALIVIAIVFIYTSNATYGYQAKGMEHLKSLEGLGMLNKINSCFAYEDKGIGRVYTNIIDLEKFNQENLEKCTSQPITIKLTTEEKEEKITQDEERLSNSRKLKRVVIIKEKEKEDEGVLEIEIRK